MPPDDVKAPHILDPYPADDPSYAFEAGCQSTTRAASCCFSPCRWGPSAIHQALDI